MLPRAIGHGRVLWILGEQIALPAAADEARQPVLCPVLVGFGVEALLVGVSGFIPLRAE